MAITIIKGGKNEFVGHCKWCGCDFRYTSEDVRDHNVLSHVVQCPQAGCGHVLQHHGEGGTRVLVAVKHSRSISCRRCILHLGVGGKPSKLRVYGSSREGLDRQFLAAGWRFDSRRDRWVCPRHRDG
jgi:hypothetical protein